jgi:hypothetical protein
MESLNVEAEKSIELDYIRLESRKNELVDQILGDESLSAEDRDYLVCRIFEHSTTDGLDLADALSWDQEKRIKAITRKDFTKKHLDFSRKLRSKLVGYEPFAG